MNDDISPNKPKERRGGKRIGAGRKPKSFYLEKAKPRRTFVDPRAVLEGIAGDDRAPATARVAAAKALMIDAESAPGEKEEPLGRD